MPASNLPVSKQCASEARATCFRKGDPQKNVFFTHCDRGELDYLHALALHIDPIFSLYGLSSTQVGNDPMRTVEGMALSIVGQILAIQPIGPYRIVGRSFGGILAYEITQQLIGDDHAVEFLGLINTYFAAEPSKELLEKQPLQQVLGNEPNYTIAHRNYEVQPSAIPVHLFITETTDTQDASLGWKSVLSGEQIDLRLIPGTHDSMMSEPSVQYLCNALATAMHNTSIRRSKLYSPLVPLQAGNKRQLPLFCVPGAGDSVTRFIELMSALGPNWPIQGFQPRGLDCDFAPHVTVEAASHLYLKELDSFYPEGGMHLLGHSFGGWIAFEMALRLMESGKHPISLYILDTRPPSQKNESKREFDRVDVIMKWVELFELMLERPLGLSRGKLAPLDAPIQRSVLHSMLVREGIMRQRTRPDVIHGPLRVFGASLRTTYAPKTIYTKPMWLFLSDDPRNDRSTNERVNRDTVDQWRRWAPNLVYKHVSGNHFTMLTAPHLLPVVDTLRTIHSDSD
jgi:thioesterase domain-containing protein